MKTYSFCFIFVFFAILGCKCQDTGRSIIFHPARESFNNEIFTLKIDSIEVEGIFVGNKDEKKPLILFIQGSEPVPLFCSVGDTIYYPLVPHQIIEKKEFFNFVFLSKPGVPALTDIKELDKNYYYLDQLSKKTPSQYIKNNTLPYYNHIYSSLIKELNKINEYSELIVMGHSQGARVVAELSTNVLVDKIVYMSADPLGRIAIQYDKEYAIFKERNDEKLTFYNSLFDSKKADSLYRGDTYDSWKSFSIPSIITLTQSKVPLLIVYGRMDENCPNCYIFSFLPNYFENIYVIAYKNYDHNFFDTQRKNNWDIVINDVCKWIESH